MGVLTREEGGNRSAAGRRAGLVQPHVAQILDESKGVGIKIAGRMAEALGMRDLSFFTDPTLGETPDYKPFLRRPVTGREAAADLAAPMPVAEPSVMYEPAPALYVEWLRMTSLPRPIDDETADAALSYIQGPGGGARLRGLTAADVERFMVAWKAAGGEPPPPELSEEGQRITQAALESAKKKGLRPLQTPPKKRGR